VTVPLPRSAKLAGIPVRWKRSAVFVHYSLPINHSPNLTSNPNPNPTNPYPNPTNPTNPNPNPNPTPT